MDRRNVIKLNLKNLITAISNKVIMKFWNKPGGGMALAVGHYEILPQGVK